ncbi:MAG: replication-relaxation family protein [Deltaproteobacteria bacterium]|nr:replication-relaxation family protein [Deltaproteobacteria bacterium]
METATEKRTRRRRTEKPARRIGRLTDRDLAILEFVGRCRAVQTTILAALYFGDPSTCSRRLARLVGAGMLRCHVEHLNAANWYTLNERAAEILVAEDVAEESLFTGRLPSAETLEHLERLNEFRAALLLESRDAAHGVTLRTFLADHDLRRLAGAHTPDLVPDAIVQLAQGNAPTIGLAVEIDLAHYSPRIVAERKGRVTLGLAKAHAPLWGLPDGWRPLFLAPSVARLRTVARALVDEGAGDLWWGTTFELIVERGPLGPAYASMREIAAAPRGEPVPFTRSVLPATSSASTATG